MIAIALPASATPSMGRRDYDFDRLHAYYWRTDCSDPGQGHLQ
jgi:hypothetical protein